MCAFYASIIDHKEEVHFAKCHIAIQVSLNNEFKVAYFVSINFLKDSEGNVSAANIICKQSYVCLNLNLTAGMLPTLY